MAARTDVGGTLPVSGPGRELHMRWRWAALLTAVRVTVLVVCAHVPDILAFFAAHSKPVLR